MIPKLRKAKIQSSLKKSLGKTKLKKSIDAMAWLNYILFMRMLAAESQTVARSEKSRVVTAQHIRAVKKRVTRKLRG